MLRGVSAPARRHSHPVLLSKRAITMGGFGMHTRYAQVTTAKMDPCWPTWMEEYEFDDLPYSHRDLFHPHETSIRQMRLIESEIVQQLLLEDRVPEALIPACKEIFATPETERDRVIALWWEIEDMYKRVHPDYLAEKAIECPVTYHGMMEVASALRQHIRSSKTVRDVLFNYSDSHFTPVAEKFQHSNVPVADYPAFTQAQAIQAAGGPAIPFRFGRSTAQAAPRLPDLATEDAAAIRARFPGFTDDEIVALGSLQCLNSEKPNVRFSRDALRDGFASKQGAFADEQFNQSVSKYVKDFDLLQTNLRDAYCKLQEQNEPNLFRTPLPPRPGSVDDWGINIGVAENRVLDPPYPESDCERKWRLGEMA